MTTSTRPFLRLRHPIGREACFVIDGVRLAGTVVEHLDHGLTLLVPNAGGQFVSWAVAAVAGTVTSDVSTPDEQALAEHWLTQVVEHKRPWSEFDAAISAPILLDIIQRLRSRPGNDEGRCEWCGTVVPLRWDEGRAWLPAHRNGDSEECPGAHSDDYERPAATPPPR